MKICKFVLSFLLIMSLFTFSPVSQKEASAASPYIDSYLKVNSVERYSDGRIAVNYTMLKDFTPGTGLSTVSFTIGREWPLAYRLSTSQNYHSVVSYKKGTYTKVLPAPSVNIIGSLNVVAKVSAQKFNETKQLKTVKNTPSGVTVKYHTVSATEAVTNFAIVVVAPGVYTTFMPQTKVFKFLGGTYLGATMYAGLKDSLNTSTSFPLPKAGHYYQTTTYYNSYGLNVHTVVWTNKESFSKNVSPIFTGTVTNNW